jgi:hypothetical protein
MSLLPLQIVLGLQVAAAAVIFIQLIADDDEDSAVRLQRVRRSAAKKRVSNRSFEEDAK